MDKPSKEAYIKAIVKMLEKIPADKVERLYQHIQFLGEKIIVKTYLEKQKNKKEHR